MMSRMEEKERTGKEGRQLLVRLFQEREMAEKSRGCVGAMSGRKIVM